MNVFLDTNVVIDFMGKREGFFDDAVQYLSSLTYHPDVIITRDKKGFNDFDILVMTPAEFISKVKE